jgi:large subunit ribosomal protein L3
MATMFHRGILGTKLGMTRLFQENGDAVSCTLIQAGPCTVVQRKTAATDGYDAVQLGYGTRSAKRVTKPLQGHFKKAGATESFRHLREVRYGTDAKEIPAVGDKVTCAVFTEGDFVDVVGTMKGRGHAGVVRRHHFATQPESHGNHYFWRHSGSIGCRKPQHTIRGMRMAGQLGNSRSTMQNLKVVRVDAEQNLLYVGGAVPGPDQGLVLVRQAKKRPPTKAGAKKAETAKK